MNLLPPRIIFHVDMDAFFASVEILLNPALKGKPVIVGGNPDKRGVVSTSSYEARKYGVRSAMSLSEAKKRCPHGIFLEGSFSLYQEYSLKIMDILMNYSPLTEVLGIDEAYMDVTQVVTNHGTAFKMGQKIRQTIFQHTGLTCSLGIGSNKLISKIAASCAKPNGLYEVPVGLESKFLGPLPIEHLPGIGAKTQITLNQQGLKYIKDLQSLGMDELIKRYGTFGYYVHLASWGKDNRPVEIDDLPPKSIGAETTFDEDQTDLEFLQKELVHIFNKAYRRLRKHSMRTRGFSLKLRYMDFKTITRSHTLETHTNEYERLLTAVLQHFKSIYPSAIPLRLIGISFEKLTDTYWQPTFWDWLKEQENTTA